MIRLTLPRHALTLALVGHLSCALFGCSDSNAQDRHPRPPKSDGEWPSYRGNPALQGVARGNLATRFKLKWSFKTEGAILSSPVVSDGLVYFGSSDQSIYAVDLQTGKKKWSFATDDMIDAPPMVIDGRVYIGSADFFLYALDAKTGELAWKFETGDKILGAANYVKLADGSTRILIGSYDSKLYCFDTDGKKLWDYETGNYINGTPAIFGDHVVFGGCDAVLHVVSATTGKKVKEVNLGDECYVAGSVALAGTNVFFGHYGNAFINVDLNDVEKPVWVYPSDRHAFFSSPAIGEDRIVFGGRDKHLHCAKRSDGTKIWSFKTKRKVDGSPVICGGKVVFGSGDGRLYVLDLLTGAEIWKYEIGQAIYSSPAIVDGMILVGSNDERLYAFEPAKSDKRP